MSRSEVSPQMVPMTPASATMPLPSCILVDSFRVVTRQTWAIGWRSRATHENRQENIRCHERIATAILAQDPGRAEAAIGEHFDSAVTVLLRAGVR
ncbi:FCD domain-containing protein [Paracoccus pantotrophus]|uniref:FCD domain-containing protein n=2 Tax=Paracoccus pantotrophus TaxID=82367 RepID=UPI0009F3359C